MFDNHAACPVDLIPEETREFPDKRSLVGKIIADLLALTSPGERVLAKISQTISGIYNPDVYRLKPLKIAPLSNAVAGLLENNWPSPAAKPLLPVRIATFRDANATLSGDIATLSDDIAVMHDDKMAMHNDIAVWSDDITTLSNDITTMSDDIASVSNDKIALRDDNITLSDDKIAQRDDMAALPDAKTALAEVNRTGWFANGTWSCRRKAPEDWSTPRRCAFLAAPGSRAASWTAATPGRFVGDGIQREVVKPPRRRGILAAGSTLPLCDFAPWRETSFPCGKEKTPAVECGRLVKELIYFAAGAFVWTGSVESKLPTAGGGVVVVAGGGVTGAGCMAGADCCLSWTCLRKSAALLSACTLSCR